MKNIIKKNQLMITALAIMIAIAGYLQFAENTAEKADAKQSGKLQSVDSGKVISENYKASDLEAKEVTDALDGILDLSEEDILNLSENTLADGSAIGYQEKEIDSLDSDVNVVMEDYLEDGMEIVSENAQDNVWESPKDGEIPGEAVYTSAGAIEVLTDAKLLKEQTRAKNREMLLDIIGNEHLGDDQKKAAVDSMVTMTRIAEKEAAAEILLEAKGFSDVVVSISGDSADVVVNAVSLTDAQRAQIEDIVKRKTDIAPENIIISTVVRD